MTYTENYELNQWQKSDRIMMSDFNSDNAKIDAALGTIAGKANCAFGTYVGTGTYGEDNKNSLTLPFVPRLLLVARASSGLHTNSSYPYRWDNSFLWTQGMASVDVAAYVNSSHRYSDILVTLQDKTISWWTRGNAPDYQANLLNTTYFYIALG